MNRFAAAACIPVVLGAWGAHRQVQAQDAEVAPDLPINNAVLDIAVPTTPAFTILGVTPESVIRPDSPRAFATSLLQGADPNGNFQAGLAFDIAPYLIAAGDSLTLREYREDFFRRFLARTQLSLATAKGLSGDDDALRLGLGLHLTLWDKGDPRLDDALIACFDRTAMAMSRDLRDRFVAAQVAGDEAALAQIEQERLALESEMKQAVRACRQDPQLRSNAWNASAWSVGLAPTWTSPSSAIDDLEWSGIGVWTSLAYGFENAGSAFLEQNAQIAFHARYRSDELVRVPDPDGDLLDQDSYVIGLQTRIAGPDVAALEMIGGPDLNFLLDLSYVSQDRDGAGDDELVRYVLGAELRLVENTYLQLSLGSESGGADDNSFILGRLKWALSPEPTLAVR